MAEGDTAASAPPDPPFAVQECPQCHGCVAKEDVTRRTWYREAAHAWFHLIQQACPHCGDSRQILFRREGGMWVQQGNVHALPPRTADEPDRPSAGSADEELAGDLYEIDQRPPPFDPTDV